MEDARHRGFLGRGPVAAHVVHARAYAAGDAIGTGASRALDLGSGGGVPGLVLALELPFSTWTLLDANQRRAAFLVAAVDHLGLRERVDVVNARAEVAGRHQDHRGRYDVVVARGFGAPAVVAECAGPFLRVGGRLVVSEPPEGERRWPAPGLEQLGLRLRGIRSTPPRLATFDQVAACPDRFPRRTGVPAKRPLW